ncbi:hypothetical protein ACQKNS_25370 [Peribacillus sp. NPDC094092]|uniref:hypothetical protein n=1 Tax=Peribacillus sp. NPDC094092 TaxID=3390611 RepID=UPI003D08435A
MDQFTEDIEYIIVNPGTNNIPGVFTSEDVHDHKYGQAITAQEVVVWMLWIAKDILMQERSSNGDRTKYREDFNYERDQK